MKQKLIVLLSFVLVFSTMAFAQAQNKQKAKAPSVEQRVEKIATDLSLSSTEKASLQSLFVKQEVDFQKFKAETDKESADFKEKMRTFRKNQESELKALLGDEKFTKLQAIRAEQKKKK
jgi:hypothetical protein